MKLCPKCQKQFSDDANFCPVDAARLTPLESQTTQTDSLAAKYDLGEKLGGNRTGTVHRAVDKATRTAVAVKLIAPNVVALPGVAQRLERELKQLERVQSVGVAKVLGSGKRNDGETWIAMELLDGAQTLAEAITARGPIALDQAAHLVEVVGEALIEAAQVGVVHRDLAPKNIMFAGADVKLINFSLPVPTTEKVPGVPEFVAPEQVDGKPVDQRSNLYSLGALYYYVLTGQTVHGGSPEEVHRAHTNGSIKTPSSLVAVPAAVEAVIMRALDRSPTKRFLTVRQFVDEVSRVARGEADVKATQPLGKAGGKPKAELVQTLLGVRSGREGIAPAAQVPAAPVLPPAPTTAVGQAVAAPAGTVGTPPVKPSPLVVTTVAGVPTAVAPSMVSNAGITPPPAAATAASPSPASTVVGQAAAPAPAPVAQQAAPQAAISPERSPWAPPSTVPPSTGPEAPTVAPTPISQAPTAATPAAAPEAPVVPAAPVLKAPTVAPAKDSAGTSGKNPAPAGKKKAPGEGESKGKFRETMWFKKGELDAEAAQAAAAERQRTGKDTGGTDKADSLPMDERYKDDGSITRGDKEKYSLRTGGTQMMGAIKDDRARSGSRSGHISEDELISEMKGGRNKVFIMIGAAVVALIIILIVMLR